MGILAGAWAINLSNWVLVGVAIWTARIALNTLNKIERQTTAAEQEVKHLGESLAAAQIATQAAIEQTETARQTFALTQRPKLIIRNVIITEPVMRPAGDKILFLTKDQFINGQFYIVNTGSSAATIKEIYSMVFWQDKPLPMRRPYEGEDGICPVHNRLEPGESITWPFASKRALDIEREFIIRWQENVSPPLTKSMSWDGWNIATAWALSVVPLFVG